MVVTPRAYIIWAGLYQRSPSLPPKVRRKSPTRETPGHHVPPTEALVERHRRCRVELQNALSAMPGRNLHHPRHAQCVRWRSVDRRSGATESGRHRPASTACPQAPSGRRRASRCSREIPDNSCPSTDRCGLRKRTGAHRRPLRPRTPYETASPRTACSTRERHRTRTPIAAFHRPHSIHPPRRSGRRSPPRPRSAPLPFSQRRAQSAIG